ncbi:MAG: hypothetical protein EB127_25860 [Alphaproteobacteria bacterium]|nr:hypothetical protein [Alphaproteobacteria bacterium]
MSNETTYTKEVVLTATIDSRFLGALCELLVVSDPWPGSPHHEILLKTKADMWAQQLGFKHWIEAYHKLGNLP